MIRSIDLMLVVLKKLLRNQENQKTKNCLSPKNQLIQEKNCQKVGIYLILMQKKISQAF